LEFFIKRTVKASEIGKEILKKNVGEKTGPTKNKKPHKTNAPANNDR